MNAIDKWDWSRINGYAAQSGQPSQPGLLKTAMGKIRVAQSIFPTIPQGTDDPVPADTINLKTGIPSRGLTKPMVTITKSFQLADIHVNDPKLWMAMHQTTLAAQSLALVEDLLFFQGQKALVPADVTVTTLADLGDGLLGLAVQENSAISVFPRSPDSTGPSVYGSATYAAVTQGIATFGGVQGRPFALILDPITYADANIPLQDSSIITPASAIKALVDEGGFVMSPGLPRLTGLLVSLGGETTKLYTGQEPIVRYERSEKDVHFFIAKESIQFHNIDARSLIRLDFRVFDIFK